MYVRLNLKNNQILLIQISHRIYLTTKLFIVQKFLIKFGEDKTLDFST